MPQIILNVEDVKLLPSLKRVLASIPGVSVSRTINAPRAKVDDLYPKRKSGLELALDDVAAGRVTRWDDFDEFSKQVLGL